MRKIDPDNFKRATRDTPREVNRRILLNLVRERQPISRADLARTMDIARGTITALVNELIEEGLVREGDTADAPRGRKPTLLHIRAHDRLAVGVDIQRSKTHVLLSDFNGRAIARDHFRTPTSPEELVETIIGRVEDLLDTHSHVGTCLGVGVVVPGVVEGTGRVLNAPTLGWTDVDLKTPVQEALGLHVQVERDAVAGALARIWLGDPSDNDASSFVYLIVAEGVGTGLVVNGQVVRGCDHAAGEVGHVSLTLDGPLCSCGSHGCLEAYTSDAATVARYLERAGPGRRRHEVSIGDVVRLAGEGDECGEQAVMATARYLGMGVAAVINVLNPEVVIVGGEIARVWRLVEPSIREQVSARTLTAAAAATPIVPELSHGQQRLRGATALIMAPIFAAPQLA